VLRLGIALLVFLSGCANTPSRETATPAAAPAGQPPQVQRLLDWQKASLATTDSAVGTGAAGIRWTGMRQRGVIVSVEVSPTAPGRDAVTCLISNESTATITRWMASATLRARAHDWAGPVLRLQGRDLGPGADLYETSETASALRVPQDIPSDSYTLTGDYDGSTGYFRTRRLSYGLVSQNGK
jgi:hypothetical protein